jgi:membrane protease YdiL (CAAX protease family)
MDQFPPLKEQLFWIVLLCVLSFIAFRVIKKKQLATVTNTALEFISLKDVVINFGAYIALSAFAAPYVFKKLYHIYIKAPLETISLFQMFFMTLVASFILIYLKAKNIHFFKKTEPFFEILIKAVLYLLVIFPIVSLIGQICDTFLYLAFDVTGYEQMAVTFLKKTAKVPLALFASIVSIVILAPITEELLFRGFLLNFLQNRFGIKIALVVSGVLFAIFHFSISQGFGNVSLLAALSFFGIMLGIMYHKHKSLIYPILLHGLFNLLSTLRILFVEI